MKEQDGAGRSVRRGAGFWTVSLGLVLVVTATSTFAQEPPRFELRREGPQLKATWLGAFQQPSGEWVRPFFELQESFDLISWHPVGERLRAAPDQPGEMLELTIAPEQGHAYYRLMAIAPRELAKLGDGGAEVFGYGDAFAAELERGGQITSGELATLFPSSAQYLSGIGWDPATATYWDQFNADPAAINQGKQLGDPGFRTFDFRLDPGELERFRQHGFVVSERLGTGSFAEAFYNLWHNDLPVFISTDAILQAWHRTYDAMLEEIEETYLLNSVQTMLDGMASQLPAAFADAGNGDLRDSMLDADYFLTVARSLLAGNGAPVASMLDQDTRVAETLADVRAEHLKSVADFMGSCRVVDFSQFKVRGHYTHSERLGRYFRCVMWLGRIDLAVAGGPFKRCPGVEQMASPRELGTAVVLWHLLRSSGQLDSWADMERIIQTFVGWTDSMTFGQLSGLLAGAGIRTLADVTDLPSLERIQSQILRGELGVQNIRSDWFEQPVGGAGSYALPRSFTVFGQKFIPDSWVFSQTVFESILWVESGVTSKVMRRVPGALDVAFSVLGNDQVVPELIAQMNGTFPDPERPHARQFRDGLPYQHNLAAVRGVMDRQTPEAWDSNLYWSWLACLRELSTPTTEAGYPEAMRTRAWATKTLNTQLASWTHLRHDTILYAKQSYTGGTICLYPTGYIEPRLAFWTRFREMVSRAAQRIASLEYAGTTELTTNQPPRIDPITGEVTDPGGWRTNMVSLETIQSRQVSHLREFADLVARLERLVIKELAQECFTAEDETFLDGLMEERNGGICGGPWLYSGWYPRLFYRTIFWTDAMEFHQEFGAGAFDALVADVHTDVPSAIPPDDGGVLHQAVGRANLLLFAAENGADRFVCAGPVLSHYEFEVLGTPRRLADHEWRGILSGDYPDGVPPSRIEGISPPVWTQSYLVPHRAGP